MLSLGYIYGPLSARVATNVCGKGGKNQGKIKDPEGVLVILAKEEKSREGIYLKDPEGV